MGAICCQFAAYLRFTGNLHLFYGPLFYNSTFNPYHLTLATYVVEEHLSRKDINAAMQQAIKNATPVAAGLLSLSTAHLLQISI